MTTELWMRIDIRGAGIAASSAELSAAAIDQAVWAEDNGFDAILFAEHHGAADGYLPSPMIMALRSPREPGASACNLVH